MQLPNYTQISNTFISEMNKLSGGAVKCFIAISRKTIGWHKTTDRISYSQLTELTGLTTNTLKSGIKELIEKNMIIQKESKYGYVYDLNISENDISKNDTAISIIHTPISKIDTSSISKIDTTKERLKETNNKETNNKERDARFKKPTLDDIAQFIKLNNMTVDPESFYSYYESNGWKVGKNPMKNWNAALRSWQRKEKDFHRPVNKKRSMDDFMAEARTLYNLYTEEDTTCKQLNR